MATSLLPPLISSYCFLVLNYVYFEKKSHLKPSYSTSWAPITVDEFSYYIALLFYLPIVTDPNISAYWSQSSLYYGSWGKHVMSRSQYKQMIFLLITDCTLEDTNNGKLAKSKIFIECN